MGMDGCVGKKSERYTSLIVLETITLQFLHSYQCEELFHLFSFNLFFTLCSFIRMALCWASASNVSVLSLFFFFFF